MFIEFSETWKNTPTHNYWGWVKFLLENVKTLELNSVTTGWYKIIFPSFASISNPDSWTHFPQIETVKNEYDGKRMQKKEMYRCKRGDESEKNNCLA